jgi:hypothetical protein
VYDVAHEAPEQIDEISNNTALLMESLWTPVETEAPESLSYDFTELASAWNPKVTEVHEEEIFVKHKLWNLPIALNGYTLKRTCEACPEQYDVFIGEQKVACIRLRHSKLTCTVPDVGGIVVYSAMFEGDDVGIFAQSERYYYLSECVDAITRFCINGRDEIADRLAMSFCLE